MALSEPLGVINGVFRIGAAILGRKPATAEKHLQARIVMRAIVSELPDDLPLKIVDHAGRTHQGIYALNVLIWNKGMKDISPSDFLDIAPLRLAVSKDSYIVMAEVMANDDQLSCTTSQVDEQSIDIYFDCINPGDYLNVIVFYGGESMAEVEVQGRIRGQATSLDHQAEEVKASLGERLVSMGILLFILNMFMGLPISAWIIYDQYGLDRLFQPRPDIPMPLLASVMMGLTFVYMFLHSRIGMWWERRKYPPGYPLHADFEPPLLENIKGIILTLFIGKKQRLSTSIFNWAKPVIIRGKKSQRRSVDDWIA